MVFPACFLCLVFSVTGFHVMVCLLMIQFASFGMLHAIVVLVAPVVLGVLALLYSLVSYVSEPSSTTSNPASFCTNGAGLV